jgi:MoxR-like ATPase
MLAIVRGTREHPAVELGASPRASLALFRASQAYAAIHGQLYVKPDDVKALAVPALAHRLTLTAQSRVRQVDAEQVVRDVLEQTAAPVESLGSDNR